MRLPSTTFLPKSAMFVVLQQMSRGAFNQGQSLWEHEVVMTEEIENAAGEQYMTIQRKALWKQTIEQGCLMDSKHTVASSLQTAILAFIRFVSNTEQNNCWRRRGRRGWRYIGDFRTNGISNGDRLQLEVGRIWQCAHFSFNNLVWPFGNWDGV